MSSITVEKTAEDPGSKSLRVTVPADRVREAEARALRYYGQRAKLPGFRPGKAPEAVIRKRFGDAIRQTVLEEVIRESWETAKSAESLHPIADPSIRNLKFEEGSGIEFELLVEVKPELALGQLSGFRAERRRAAVSESTVDEQLHKLQEQKAAWIPVEGAKPSPDHMVRVEVASLGDGAAGQAQPYDLVLGQNQAIPELEERIPAVALPFAFVGRMFVIGRGPEYATAREIALKLLETCRVAAEPLTATDLSHGPIAAVDSLFPVWAIASDDVTLPIVTEAAERIRATGATLVASGTTAASIEGADYALPVPVPPLPLLSPILSVVPGQLFALALARAKGLDPDEPRGLSKITLVR